MSATRLELAWKRLCHRFEQVLAKRKQVAPELDAYSRTIDRFNASQPNAELLDRIRQYNHQIIDDLNRIKPLSGLRILDVGASPHGYALERALHHGVEEYTGIGLDISEPFHLQVGRIHGRLVAMDAENLAFGDSSFDAIVSMSTFEHIGNVGRALAEFRRVIKLGGCALISFEPIWTCSYGHHLHHFGPVSKLIPDWSHLFWSREQMAEHLKQVWPNDAPLSRSETVNWIFDNPVINRVGLAEMKQLFLNCGMHVEWMLPIRDEGCDQEQLELASSATGLSRDELMTRGLSVLLARP